jgi:hypothetical protein
MKIDIDLLKKMIATEALGDVDGIISQFCDEDKDFKQFVIDHAGNPKDWNSRGSSKTSKFFGFPKGTIEYDFDCEPFDDQLRAYVYVGPDGSVLKINILGE